MGRIHVSYIATRPERGPEALARAIALEQSVECVEELLDERIRDALVGRVESVEDIEDGRCLIRISHAPELACGRLGPLIQLLYGVISFYPRLKLTAVDLPPEVVIAMPGPRLGADGLRELTGARGRALLGTVLKPRGADSAQLARIARGFAGGGGDVLKDDQNLVDAKFDEFTRRVDACATAVERGNEERDGQCLYFPHVTGAGEDLRRQFEWVAGRGLPGVLMCGFILGLETASSLAAEHGLGWISHPALAGAWTEPAEHGIAPEIAFGTLIRAAGADISLFPARGGRVSTGVDADRDVARELLREIPGWRPALPGPAGGKTVDMLPELADEFGKDALFLIGGDLLKAGEGLRDATRQAVEVLERSGRGMDGD